MGRQGQANFITVQTYLLVVSIKHLSLTLVVITYHVADEDTAAVDHLCLLYLRGGKWSILSPMCGVFARLR